MTTQRHVDTGTRLTSYADEVQVLCPRCKRHGRVLATWQPYAWVASFYCSACGLGLASESGHWVGPIVYTGRRPCGNCGFHWLSVRESFPTLPPVPLASKDVRCPECGSRSTVSIRAEREMPADKAIDPHFGMQLLMTTDCRHGVLWAYNRRHLHELQAYVSAKLRVRHGIRGKAMFSRLPTWMKLAKHREEVLKGLQRLERMALPESARN